MSDLVLEAPKAAFAAPPAFATASEFDLRVGEATRFLTTLFGGYEQGFIEWRAFSKVTGGDVARRRDYRRLPLTSPRAFATEMVRLSDAGWDVYIGVLPRSEKRGVADSVRVARWMWADLDGKNMDDAAIEKACKGADMVVHSGHGTHAYWLMSKPRDLSTMEEKETFVVMLRKLQLRVSGGAADDVSDLPRILRVPGTWNWKRGQKVAVTLERCPAVVDDPEVVPENESLGDEEIARIRLGMKEMEAAAHANVLPILYPAWHSCRGHIVNDPNVWVRGQITWFKFMLQHQMRVRAIDDPEEAIRRGTIVDGCVDEMSEDFTNLFLELERRGYNPIGFRDNPLFMDGNYNAD